MPFICPVCHAERPDEIHLDWCDYDGPDMADLADAEEDT